MVLNSNNNNLLQLDAWNDGSELSNHTNTKYQHHQISLILFYARHSFIQLIGTPIQNIFWIAQFENLGSFSEFFNLFACNHAVILQNQEDAEAIKPHEPRFQSLGNGVGRLYNYL